MRVVHTVQILGHGVYCLITLEFLELGLRIANQIREFCYSYDNRFIASCFHALPGIYLVISMRQNYEKSNHWNISNVVVSRNDRRWSYFNKKMTRLLNGLRKKISLFSIRKWLCQCCGHMVAFHRTDDGFSLKCVPFDNCSYSILVTFLF